MKKGFFDTRQLNSNGGLIYVKPPCCHIEKCVIFLMFLRISDARSVPESCRESFLRLKNRLLHRVLVDFLFQFLAYLVGSLIHGLVCLVFQFFWTEAPSPSSSEPSLLLSLTEGIHRLMSWWFLLSADCRHLPAPSPYHQHSSCKRCQGFRSLRCAACH